MNITIDADKLSAHVQSAVEDAVKDAFSDYAIKRSVADVVGAKLAQGLLDSAVATAFDTLALDTLGAALARDVADAIRAGVRAVVVDALAVLVAQLRGYKEFEKDYNQHLQAIRAELAGVMPDTATPAPEETQQEATP